MSPSVSPAKELQARLVAFDTSSRLIWRFTESRAIARRSRTASRPACSPASVLRTG